ncbi:NADPH-dependent 2,4-dienoyl-CoA reductase, sulfur reductase [Granulicatella balaenopterae]|uniref:NADPH-dependent 2,4-dienoyl-CoA reductase, sulfur reductase n=1 Tax=Granulicatella balaenopterae TaxID=137733 RepID=A0A1H9KE82_9LACT|nr:FAD-dependent oxidoreductase [Granulicatella balaenopterae]SEQ97388.1 NADPH-dependent 2,4-dienoyl-CoA reductase, sulfur reductase [Granulicatella balaenopterae]
MSKKYVVVGGVAGGMSTAARIKRIDPYAEVLVFERDENVSFSNCCLPFHLNELIVSSCDLVLMTPEKLKKQYNLDVKVLSEVVKINRDEKSVTIKNVKTGETYDESYDVLVLSPGAKAIRPKSIKGVDNKNVFVVKNVGDVDSLKRYIDDNKIDDVAVIGGGFIGLECMVSLREAGKNVTLVEGLDQILTPMDHDIVQILHKEIHDKGVELILNDTVTEITDNEITLASGKEVKAGAVVLAVGVTPETSLAVEAGLEIGSTGGILVNHHYQTTDPSIYAVGDAIEVTDFITNKKTRLTLAGPAQRQARAAADHMFGRTYRNTGVIGSSVIKIFDYNAACTGLNEKACQEAGIEYDVAYVIPKDRVGLMPEANPIHFKLIYQVPTGQILGGQSVGKGNVDKRVDVIAAMIMNRANIEDLKELELCYSPWFGTAKDPVNMAALVATNLLNGEYKQVRLSEVRSLVESGAMIIDAREAREYEEGHIKGAINIPLSEFRQRLDEIPTDKPVYVHCLSSQRSYYMVRELTNRGYSQVYNIQGSFLAISCYEYFTDITTGREPIVTNYRFDLL